MNDRVRDGAVATHGAFESDGRLESVSLGAIFNLNMVEDDLSLSPCTIRLEHVCGENLTAPAVSILTNNLNVSCEKNNFTTHIDSIIVLSGGKTITPMIVIECLVESDKTILVTNDSAVVRMVVLHGSWGKIDLVTLLPVETLLNEDLILATVNWRLQTRLSASLLSIELDVAHSSEDLVASRNSSAENQGLIVLIAV